MAIGDLFTKALAISGKNKASTVNGTEGKLSTWLLDAKDGKQSVDFLFVGDSNTCFAGDYSDFFNGIHDAWSRVLVDLGIPLYGSPLIWAGGNPNSMGLFSTPYVGTTNQQGIFGPSLTVTTTSGLTVNISYGTGHLAQAVPVSFSAGTAGITQDTTYYIKAVASNTTFTITTTPDGTGNAIGGISFPAGTVMTYTSGYVVKTLKMSAASGASTLTTAVITTASGSYASSDPVVTWASNTIVVASSADLTTGLNVAISATLGGLSAGSTTTYTIAWPGSGISALRTQFANVSSYSSTNLNAINGAIKPGWKDLDPEFTQVKNDLAVPRANNPEFPGITTDSRYSFATQVGNFPNDVGGDHWLKVEAGATSNQHTISMYYNSAYTSGHAASLTNVGWASIQNGSSLTGRVLYAVTPNSNDNYGGAMALTYTNGGSPTQFATAAVIDATTGGDSFGYKASESTVPATSRTMGTFYEFKFGAVGTNDQIPSKKLGIVLYSIHCKNVIGFAATPLYYRGGSTIGHCVEDLTLLNTWNGMKKVQIYFREVVNRQKSASSKNTGRVCIVVQFSTNGNIGNNTAEQIASTVNQFRELQRLYTLAWTRAGYSPANLTFVILSGPITYTGTQAAYDSNGDPTTGTPVYITEAGTEQAPYHVEFRKLLFKVGFDNAIIVHHEKNLTLADFSQSANNRYFSTDITGTTGLGTNLGSAHLSDAGYIAWAKVLIGNILTSSLGFMKKKK